MRRCLLGRLADPEALTPKRWPIAAIEPIAIEICRPCDILGAELGTRLAPRDTARKMCKQASENPVAIARVEENEVVGDAVASEATYPLLYFREIDLSLVVS